VNLSSDEISLIESSPRKVNLIHSSCSVTSTALHVSGARPQRKCKKLQSKTFQNDRTLQALFEINSTGCRTWWIVLVSVLSSLVLLGIIVALVATFDRRAKAALRPFWVRNKDNTR
jgi:hypothetical protein